MGDGDDDVLDGDQVLQPDLILLLDDLRASRVAVNFLDFLQLALDDFLEDLVAGEDLLILGDFLLKLIVFRLDLVALESGEALQLHFQDSLRLAIGKFEGGDQSRAGFGGGLGGADQLDDGVEL